MIDNKEYKAFNPIANALDFSILEHGYLHADEEWVFHDVISPFNRMYFVIDGSGLIYNKDAKEKIQAGKVYMVPLGTSFDYRCDHLLHMFYIHFRLELIPGIDLFEPESSCLSHDIDSARLTDLVAQASRTQVSDILKCKAVFYEYIGHFLDMNSALLEDQVSLMGNYGHVYRFVQEHCSAKLKVSDVATHFGSTLSTFSKRFKTHTGMTPKSYIDKKLVREAQQKLLITDMTVREIAYDLKFSDEFHFSRYFKKHVGSSPNYYRQRSNIYK